ncbi:MAG TPA: hypothetical protein VFL57_01265, partial [Bryobacteraceae bacterium]|nr:hypothetical protein [Bryobacteraceae bacterium]
GQIQLVLRNGGDENIEKTPGTTVAAIYSAKAIVEPQPERPAPRPRPRPIIVQAPVAMTPPPPPPTPPSEIIMIRGNTRSVEVIKPGSAN